MVYEFERLSEVELIETASDEANVLVEENGEIKRVAKTEVGGAKETKELMYEWDFSVDDEVYEINENTDDDISWITTKNENVDVLIEARCYAMDDSTSEYIEGIETVSWLNSKYPYSNGYITNTLDKITGFNGNIWSGPSYFDGNNFSLVDIDFTIESNIHYDEDYNRIKVEQGGIFRIYAYDTAFKSIRIYKVTRG